MREAYPSFDREIALAYESTCELKAIEQLALQKARSEQFRQNHTPCLVVDTITSCPTQITLYAMAGRRFKIIRLPVRISTVEEERGVRIVRRIIKGYLKKFGGACPFWGPVTGFTFSKTIDQQIVFDREGSIVGRKSEPPKVLQAEAFVSLR